MELTEEQAQAVLDGIRPEAMWDDRYTAYINQVGDLLIIERRGSGHDQVTRRVKGTARHKLDVLADLHPRLNHVVIPSAA